MLWREYEVFTTTTIAWFGVSQYKYWKISLFGGIFVKSHISIQKSLDPAIFRSQLFSTISLAQWDWSVEFTFSKNGGFFICHSISVYAVYMQYVLWRQCEVFTTTTIAWFGARRVPHKPLRAMLRKLVGREIFSWRFQIWTFFLKKVKYHTNNTILLRKYHNIPIFAKTHDFPLT